MRVRVAVTVDDGLSTDRRGVGGVGVGGGGGRPGVGGGD